MAERVDIPNIERLTFFTGQRLTATDLAELQRAHRELRWLHNRSLHSWGIGIDLAVTGERGDSAITVGPGYGVDCRGREIILTEPLTKTVPAVAGAPGGGEAVYYLVAAYQEDADQKVLERRPGVCLPEGTVRLSEEPLLDWRRPDQLKDGLELILAQAWIQNCQLSRPLALEVRRYARPSQQPYIAAGQTPAGGTDWRAWEVGNPPQPIGFQTDVDTSAARFRTTPSYVAHVVGGRFREGGHPFPQAMLLKDFVSIIDQRPDGFRLQVLLPQGPESGEVLVNPSGLFHHDPHVGTLLGSLVLRDQLKWHVVWMGIEG